MDNMKNLIFQRVNAIELADTQNVRDCSKLCKNTDGIDFVLKNILQSISTFQYHIFQNLLGI